MISILFIVHIGSLLLWPLRGPGVELISYPAGIGTPRDVSRGQNMSGGYNTAYCVTVMLSQSCSIYDVYPLLYFSWWYVRLFAGHYLRAGMYVFPHDIRSRPTLRADRNDIKRRERNGPWPIGGEGYAGDPLRCVTPWCSPRLLHLYRRLGIQRIIQYAYSLDGRPTA